MSGTRKPVTTMKYLSTNMATSTSTAAVTTPATVRVLRYSIRITGTTSPPNR